MTTNTANTEPTPSQLRGTLAAYEPTGLAQETWALVRAEAIELALRAGAPDDERSRKDLQLLADVVRHLSRTRTELTLDNILADTTLASFDSEQAPGAASTRENKRGRFRRLQAAHRGVPWRKERRADGERTSSLVQPDMVDTVARLLPADRVPGRSGAGALQAALDDARLRRRRDHGSGIDAPVWTAARKYAHSHDARITKRDLDAVATYEVLQEIAPVVALIQTYSLTRRDLDLALNSAARLPNEPDPAQQALLRG
jgi:hypothetical protein